MWNQEREINRKTIGTSKLGDSKFIFCLFMYLFIHLFIYGLFGDAVSTSYYIASNKRMINELERM
jgi:hypothetical protein